ncbi:ABC transporter ATP-binding protein [Fodinicola acaciae]|uniref:ABC transporter ATP-binding protein n=1 Tax=Fodinicola acaciae TaxID=2681555 RepID=UPI0013D0AA5E|nr:ABC transporter ATP-binding protein [Fodinicola acaciae]
MVALLELENLTVTFDTDDGPVTAVDGLNLVVRERETLGIVGESGSGKSVTALTVMRLLTNQSATVTGSVRFRGKDLVAATEPELRGIRGRQIAMVYQDPMTALNPVIAVGRQLTQVLRHHLRLGRREAFERAVELLTLVGIPDPKQRLSDYPHQFSGGQRQRLVIALALSCNPALLIADEPTTALDVTVQAQIIELVRKLRDEFDTAIVWITHDLGVVAGLVDRVAVMYAGHIVEQADVRPLFAQPRHPYTAGLLRSLPPATGERSRLVPIAGSPPDLARLGPGCPFGPRCEHARAACGESAPPLVTVADRHDTACFRHAELVRDAS